MSAAVVRAAVAADARGLATVHVRSWQAAYRGLVPDELLDELSVGARTARWERILGGEGAPGATFVAEGEDGTVIGFCSVVAPSRDEDAGPDTGEIAAAYVDPAHWRTGVGRALMHAALEALRADGRTTVTLWVFAANRTGRAFYAALGFVPDGAELVHAESGQPEVRLRARLAP